DRSAPVPCPAIRAPAARRPGRAGRALLLVRARWPEESPRVVGIGRGDGSRGPDRATAAGGGTDPRARACRGTRLVPDDLDTIPPRSDHRRVGPTGPDRGTREIPGIS